MSTSWTGIPLWRRVAYYAAWVPAVLGALLLSPSGSGSAGGGWSPTDPRRLRDEVEPADDP